MTIRSSEMFAAFVSLNRYFSLSETAKPTLQQAEEALHCTYKIYGVENEDELFKLGQPEVTETYREMKQSILQRVAK